MVSLMKQSSQEELVKRAQSGDAQAFQELATEYRARTEAVIRSKFAGALTHEDIADVVQETFLRAFRGIAGFTWQDEDSYFRWLSGIAVNVAHKSCKRGKRNGPVLDQDPADSVLSQSKAMRREERFDRLQAAMNYLSPEYRQVLLLVRVEGLPIKEVARRLNKTPNAVSRLMLRASRKLKEIFGETESLQLPPRTLNGREKHSD